jgi:hypothetical protein
MQFKDLTGRLNTAVTQEVIGSNSDPVLGV